METGATLSLAGAATVATHHFTGVPVENQTVSYEVKGFSCVTCATGLEVQLRDLKGVVRAHASYPEAAVVIGFDQNIISAQMLRDAITNCGFSIA